MSNDQLLDIVYWTWIHWICGSLLQDQKTTLFFVNHIEIKIPKKIGLWKNYYDKIIIISLSSRDSPISSLLFRNPFCSNLLPIYFCYIDELRTYLALILLPSCKPTQVPEHINISSSYHLSLSCKHAHTYRHRHAYVILLYVYLHLHTRSYTWCKGYQGTK